MKTTISHGYSKNGRPHTTVQAGDVYNDVLYTVSVDARGGLALAKQHAINLVKYNIAQAKTRDFADFLGRTGVVLEVIANAKENGQCLSY